MATVVLMVYTEIAIALYLCVEWRDGNIRRNLGGCCFCWLVLFFGLWLPAHSKQNVHEVVLSTYCRGGFGRTQFWVTINTFWFPV